MTYSIVARDRATGLLGIGVQSCVFGVGAIVPWARPGIGAIASQGIAEPAYGPRCLDAIAGGATATEALDLAKSADPGALLRQVGVVAVDGSVAVWTGDGCIDHAGDVVGDDFAVQANMMASPKVWPAMADAYIATEGPLDRRLLAALEAAQAAGGDARGRMSAAIVVVSGERADPSVGRVIDVRVDRSDNPLGELHRLLDAADAYRFFGAAVDRVFAGDADAALAKVEKGLTFLPGDGNLRFVRAGALLASGDIDAGRAVLQELVNDRPTWDIIVRSFSAKGLLPVPEDALSRRS